MGLLLAFIIARPRNKKGVWWGGGNGIHSYMTVTCYDQVEEDLPVGASPITPRPTRDRGRGRMGGRG